MQRRVARLLAVHRTIRPTPQHDVYEGDAPTDNVDDDIARQNRQSCIIIN